MKNKYSILTAIAGSTLVALALSSNASRTFSAQSFAASSQQEAKPAATVPQLKPNPSPDSQQQSPGVQPRPDPKPYTPPDATLLPGFVRQARRVTSVADTPGSNWDFEDGLAGWTPTGEAFANQPTLGDNVAAARVRTDMTLERGGIGGDYWKRVPYPIGHHLNAWVGTYENHPDAGMPLGLAAGDESTGTLTSGIFLLDEAHRFIAFMVGGGSDVATERVELQIRGEDDADVAVVERLIGANRDGAAALALIFGITGSAANGVGSRDGNYVIVLTASGQNSEVMRPMVFEVPRALWGRRARIRIVDNSSGSWGHINVDDFRFGSVRPPARATPVWGFADTHTHPMNDLSFGGNVTQGSLYARDGSIFASDAYRRAALPPMFESLTSAQRGTLDRLLAPLFSATADLTRTMRSGYPEMQGYPSFNQVAGQQMYGEWIHRAYEGGLRLMSALAVNNWLASSHPIKIAILGTSQAKDDRESGNEQMRDIKAWVARPENRAWVEIAYTPADARRIISENKLAIVLGLELDVLGNFVPNDHFDQDDKVVMPDEHHPVEQRERIVAELDRLYAQGVRQVGPFHYVSGVWGGCAMSQRLFNEVNRKITGENVKVDSGAELGIRYRLDMDAPGPDGNISRTFVTGDGEDRQSDPTWRAARLGHINRMPLTGAGKILFDEMARRGMLIDIDHASYRSRQELVVEARRREYPILSSHSDYLELGFTGPADINHGDFSNDDAQNLCLFDSTILDPLRHEGMLARAHLEAITELGGTTGAIMWLPRRMSWGNTIPNDCDGSSKTWAQGYQYAVGVTGGRGVALSTDRITLEPRFGPNAAYLLGLEHGSMPRRDERRFAQVDAQRNGVRYDCPMREWRAYRFTASGNSAWQKTPVPGGWEEKPRDYEDAWKAFAALAAGRNPRGTNHGIELSGDLLHPQRIVNFAWGLSSATEAEVESDCRLFCWSETLNERYAAYCVRNEITPDELVRWPRVPEIWASYRRVKTAWEEWKHMSGTNEPLRRYLFGNRDYDVNVDGVAHYGMLPDFLQDVANSHPRPSEVGTYFSPLFSSAESYISMWEKADAFARLAR